MRDTKPKKDANSAENHIIPPPFFEMNGTKIKDTTKKKAQNLMSKVYM
jgi:hypothetical protein